MRSIIATSDGAALADLDAPSAGPGSVLVRVHAAALNRADLMMLTGHGHGMVGGVGQPLGLEWAGEVVEVGPGVESVAVGDRVMAAGPRAFSQFVVTKADWVYPIPSSVSFERAAALPVSLQTMHDAIVTLGHLQAGEALLVVGGSSAMGLMGLQIGRLIGATVIGTSTSPSHRERLAEFGVDVVVDTTDPGWVKAVLRATRRKGADLTVDLLAGPLVNDTIQATRIAGRLINVGRMAGNRVDLDLEEHSVRRTQYLGTTFRTRSPDEISAVVAAAAAALLPSVADGTLHMPVDEVFPATQFQAAFDRMSANRHFGKIVLEIENLS